MQKIKFIPTFFYLQILVGMNIIANFVAVQLSSKEELSNFGMQ